MAKDTLTRWNARVRDVFGSGWRGLGAAAVASLCCAPPAVAFALGLGGSAFLVGLAQYKLYFALVGLIVMLALSWRSLRISGYCTARERRTRFLRLALMLGAFGGGYWAISYLLLPQLYTIG